MILIVWIVIMGILLPLPFIILYYLIKDDLIEYPYELEDTIYRELKGENL